MNKNYLTYPMKVMNITQTYDNSYSHKIHAMGIPFDYPIDEAGIDTGKSYAYCPADEMVIKRIYGVGNEGVNTIWLESTTKVITPTFNDYVTILFMHSNDSSLKNLKVGQKFKRNEPMFMEGNDGEVTGNHLHISVSQGKFISNGWVLNNKGAWVIKGNSKKPEDSFYIDLNFTQIKNNAGLIFQTLPQETLKFKLGDKVLLNGYLYTDSYGSKKGVLRKDFKATITQINENGTKPYNINNRLGWVSEVDLVLYSDKNIKVGDKVKTINIGKSSSDGSGKTAKKDVKGTVKRVISGAQYPYLIDNIGWYKLEDLIKL